MKTLKKDFRKQLLALQEEGYQKFTQALNPGIENMLGIRLPVLRKFAKEILKSDWQSYIADSDIKYAEELMLDAMIIGLAKPEFKELKKHFKKFIPKINGWAVCDVFCSGLCIKDENLPELFDFISPYIKSKKEFDVRFCAVMLLCFFTDKKFIKQALDILNQAKHQGYYAQMGVAWAVSILYIKQPQETLKFIRKNSLDNFTHNKSIQKICESLRVDKDAKEMLKQLKRK